MITGITPFSLPVDEQALKAVLGMYGGVLPESYALFLHQCNGGLFDMASDGTVVCFSFAHPILGSTVDARLLELYPVVSVNGGYERDTVISVTNNLRQNGFRQGMIAVGSDDGSGVLCLDSTRNGAVVFYLQDYGFENEGSLVSVSFDSFANICIRA
jgi:hypothetical protein